MESALAAIADRVRDAAAAGTALRLRGAGSKDFYGGPPRGDILDMRDYAGVVRYEPSELVLSARCGTPLAELEALLAAQGQMLAFEPPRFAAADGAGATLGGCVAAGLAGPRRASAGAVRDFVLGVRMLDGRARDLRFGGEVMKNVAGYDVSRLVTGSLGTLGAILEASLKVLPRPPAEASLRFELPEARAIETLNQWAARALPISASAWHDGLLTLRLSGAEPALRAARAALGGSALEPGAAGAYWEGLREQTDPWFGGETPLWRLSLPGTAPPLGLAGAVLLEWASAQRWLRSGADAAGIRAAAAQAGGHATLFRGGSRAGGAFAPLGAAALKIHRGLKAVFDPAGIFNPGRLYPEF